MIKEVVAQWEARKDSLRSSFRALRPTGYTSICERIVQVVLVDDIEHRWSKKPIANDVEVIDHGDWQGTQIFILHLDTYQPDANDYLWFSNEYGSCSGCDAFEAIDIPYDDDAPVSDDEVEGYMTLALHMVQRMRWLLPLQEEK